MSVAKVIEISAESTESFEGAVAEGLKRAAQTVDDIQGAWIKEQKVIVKDGKIAGYRVDMKVTFLLHEKR
jgi:flavin-binding protein dodecin